MGEEMELTAVVHHAVSSANEVVTAIDALLRTELNTFHMPRATLEMIRTILNANTQLTSKMFEEHEQIADYIDKAKRQAEG